MYKRHKIELCICSIIVLFASYLFKADYRLISEIVITIISIALAVYIAAASVLLGSPFAKELKGQIDREVTTKTLLGVLSTYLRNAGVCSIISIVVSCFYMLSPSIVLPFNVEVLQRLLGFKSFIINVLSAVSCTLFYINIFFLWQIFKFLINSLTKSVD